MIHLILRTIAIVAAIGTISSWFYYLLSLSSARTFLRERKARLDISAANLPPVSILKPLKGIDPEIYESFRSHCRQDYPEYEIIFGVNESSDPAVASVEKLKTEFPGRAITLMICSESLGANRKVSSLAQMVKTARYNTLLVNDSDIRVAPDYLRRVTAPLARDRVGLVTCLYRGAAAATLGSRLESLGISTDFCAGVLAAQKVEGSIRFGLGSTLAFRRSSLEKIGGFESFADYLADDYELGKRLAALGLEVKLSETVVETFLPAYTMREFWSHQLRWARGVRAARFAGYAGLVFTFGIFWALVAMIALGATWQGWMLLALTLFLRFTTAIAVGKAVVQDSYVPRRLWLLPLRDLIGVAVWLVSFAGSTVTWRGDRFRVSEGKLTKL